MYPKSVYCWMSLRACRESVKNSQISSFSDGSVFCMNPQPWRLHLEISLHLPQAVLLPLQSFLGIEHRFLFSSSSYLSYCFEISILAYRALPLNTQNKDSSISPLWLFSVVKACDTTVHNFINICCHHLTMAV